MPGKIRFASPHPPFALIRNMVVLFIIYYLVAGCTKYEHEGKMQEPGIALTFDDCSIDNWYRYLPLLDSSGAKATFYVSSYHKLSPEQKDKLREIQRHGNEIGYHTTYHNNLPDYLARRGIDELMRIEINQDLKKMNDDGFYPSVFAYPYGAHNYYLDNLLLKRFKSVRALNGTRDLAKSTTQSNYNEVLYALGMDNTRRSDDILNKMIEISNRHNNCLVLVGHEIENPQAKYSVPCSKLRKILQKANELHMKFYLISEISR